MNVLFITLLDFESIEEKGIYQDLMREFVKEYHKVYIISPTERRKNKPTYVIESENTKILKLQISNTQKTNLIEKGISTISLESKFKNGIKQYFADVTFDLVLYSTPPITLKNAVKYVKDRDNAKTYLLLKDIFPQNAVDLGMLKTTGPGSLIYNYFRSMEKDLYDLSDVIGCMSEGNANYLRMHNPTLHDNIIEVCPNSIEPQDLQIKDQTKAEIRSKYNIPTNKTLFVYGGNIGRPQGIDFLMECIKSNETNDQAFFVIIGSGTEFNRLSNYFKTSKPKNSLLMSQLPKSEYELLANSCDVGLIFLDPRFTIPNFPSRLLSYMQAAMPVLAATDKNTDIGTTITSGNFGYWCESGDLQSFDRFVEKLCDQKLNKQLGQNAREYLERHYKARTSYEIIMKHF
ncbi:MAG: glycosyltransferase family 4 protein [Clostridiaceae bacterium]